MSIDLIFWIGVFGVMAFEAIFGAVVLCHCAKKRIIRRDGKDEPHSEEKHRR